MIKFKFRSIHKFFVIASLSCCSFTVQSQANLYHGVFRELPSSAIRPQTWLKETLERQRDGMALNRTACGYPFEANLWIGKLPQSAWQGYEQTAYFVDGIYRAGLLLNDASLLKIGLENIQYILGHPESNGHLGPVAEDFKYDLGPDGVAGPRKMGQQWPFTVFTRAIMAYYEVTHDPSALTALTKHYKTLSPKFGIDERDVDAIEGMCWLYWHTGDPSVIEIAERTWQQFDKSTGNNPRGKTTWALDRMKRAEPLQGHGVSVSEISKQAALLYLATGKKIYLDAVAGAFRSLQRDHEMIDGALSSDAVVAGKNPDHQHETCVVTDYTWSLGYMLMSSGDAHWADGIERAIYNAGYGVITKDFKALQYYSAPNQVNITQTSNHPKASGKPNRPLQSFRTDHKPECCTGNIQRTFPTFIGRMWMTDNSGGLAAMFYGPSIVTTEVGKQKQKIEITQQTDYPFNGQVKLIVKARQPVRFPLYLRIPGWASKAGIKVNGKSIAQQVKPGTFVTLDRNFSDKDIITIDFPMELRKENPVPAGVSISRGPLLYSLLINERFEKVNNTPEPDRFPGWNVYPASAWNYGLEIDNAVDLKAFKVQTKPVYGFPWTIGTTPVVINGKAKRIDSWQLLGPHGETPELPVKGAKFEEQFENIKLVPYGATHLHLAVFPDISALR